MRQLRFIALGLIAGAAWLYALGLTPVDTFLVATCLGLLALGASLLVDVRRSLRR